MCKSCRRKGRRVGKPRVGDILETMVFATAGNVGSNFLDQVDFIGRNPYLKIGAKVVAAYYLSKQKNSALRDASVGVMVNATKDTLNEFLPGLSSTLNISGVGASMFNHKLLNGGRMNGFTNRDDGLGVAGFSNRSDGFGVSGSV